MDGGWSPSLCRYLFPKHFFFPLFFGKHNSRPDLTSQWQPQVKLIGRGPAGVSPAHHWVWNWTVPSLSQLWKFTFLFQRKKQNKTKNEKSKWKNTQHSNQHSKMDFDYYCRGWKGKNLVNIDVLFIPHRNRLVNMCEKYVLFKALGGGYSQNKGPVRGGAESAPYSENALPRGLYHR